MHPKNRAALNVFISSVLVLIIAMLTMSNNVAILFLGVMGGSTLTLANVWDADGPPETSLDSSQL